MCVVNPLEIEMIPLEGNQTRRITNGYYLQCFPVHFNDVVETNGACRVYDPDLDLMIASYEIITGIKDHTFQENIEAMDSLLDTMFAFIAESDGVLFSKDEGPNLAGIYGELEEYSLLKTLFEGLYLDKLKEYRK